MALDLFAGLSAYNRRNLPKKKQDDRKICGAPVPPNPGPDLRRILEDDEIQRRRQAWLLRYIRKRECEESGLLYTGFDTDENGEDIPEL